jgi:hypothetical protein
MARSRHRLGNVIPEALAGLGGASFGAMIASIARFQINDDSTVSLAIAASVTCGIVWLNVTLSKIKNDISSLKDARPETWTYNMQRAAMMDFKLRNPDIDVPIPLEKGPPA